MKITLEKSEKTVYLCTAPLAPEPVDRSDECFAADAQSLKEANMLVMNMEDDAGFEITGSAVFVFGGPVIFALTGAQCSALLNGSPVPRFRALSSGGENSVLEISGIKSGFVYLALSGEIDAEFYGLDAGDCALLENGADYLENLELRALTPPAPPVGSPALIRTVRAAFESDYGKKEVSSFLYHRELTVLSCDRERMLLDPGEGADIPEAQLSPDRIFTPAGLIYITEDKKIGVALPDSAPLGGIKGIAAVISADMRSLLSLSPGSRVKLMPIAVTSAHGYYRKARKSYIKNYLAMNEGK